MMREELAIERLDDEQTRLFGKHSGNGITRFDPDEELEIYRELHGYFTGNPADTKNRPGGQR